jgi:hypothetical protein
VLDKTVKGAYLTDVAIPNGHNLHSIITENFQKYADLKEKLIRMRKLKTAYMGVLSETNYTAVTTT